jgi:hypothetical protein
MAFYSRVDHVSRGARANAEELLSEFAVLELTPPDYLKSEDVTWQQVFAAEALLVKRLRPADLLARASDIYARYEELIISTRRVGYQRIAGILVTDTEGLERLRADLIRILGVMAREHLLTNEIEGERARLSSVIAMTGMTAIAGVGLFIMNSGVHEGWKVWTWIIFALLAVATTALWVRGLMEYASASELPRAAKMIAIVLLLGTASSTWAQTDTATTTETAATLATDSTATATETPATETPATETAAPNAGTAGTRTDETNAPLPVPGKKPCACDPQRSKALAEGKDVPPAGGLPACPFAGPTLVAAALMGVLGATFSILQRIQRATNDHDPVALLFAFRAAWRQLPLSLLSGAIAAMILYGIFAGEMIAGNLFPKISNCCQVEFSVMQLEHFFNYTGPASALDHAKLLVWAVVAGFSERFVPDILDKFAATK